MATDVCERKIRVPLVYFSFKERRKADLLLHLPAQKKNKFIVKIYKIYKKKRTRTSISTSVFSLLGFSKFKEATCSACKVPPEKKDLNPS